MYTVDYFIDKFSKIPSRDFIEGEFFTEVGRCANGHCGVEEGTDLTDEAIALNALFRQHGLTNKYFTSEWGTVAYINDGYDSRFQQRTPKGRILAALHDIKKMIGEPEVKRSVATEEKSERWADNTKKFTELIPVVEEVADCEVKIISD